MVCVHHVEGGAQLRPQRPHATRGAERIDRKHAALAERVAELPNHRLGRIGVGFRVRVRVRVRVGVRVRG